MYVSNIHHKESYLNKALTISKFANCKKVDKVYINNKTTNIHNKVKHNTRGFFFLTFHVF